MNKLGEMIALAAEGHAEQTDKAGKAYILHPIRMMMRLRTDDEELMMIAIGHDLIEDTKLEICELYEYGFSDRVIAGIRDLTRNPGETYDSFIRRCALNDDARIVKIEDLRDNSDITRLKGIGKKDIERMEKYHRAFLYLSGV